jgi:hypothetical protein
MGSRLYTLFGMFAMMVGCAAPKEEPVPEGVKDLRRDFPEAPEGAMVFTPPEYTIPAFTEMQMCWVGTYTGPDVGVDYLATYQAPNGHHLLLLQITADEDELPDGEAFDCTSDDDLPMTDLEPVFVAGSEVIETEAGPEFSYRLPEGMAVEMEEGIRYVVQSHYVNTTAEDILVNDQLVYTTIPADQVETWAAPMTHVVTDHPIQPGEQKTLSFDCAWEQDIQVLFLGGHMHEWGTAFSVDWTHGDGTTERLYDIPVWDPLYRDKPPFNDYEGSGLQVAQGDVFTTTCNWFNTEDYVLDFPFEMCATFGMVYPTKVPLICEPEVEG